MNTLFLLLGTYTQFAIWQSTLCLLLVLIAGRIQAKTPWKAHFLQIAGVFAAILTPLLSTVVFSTSGGVLTLSAPKLPQAETFGMLGLAGAVLFAGVFLYGIMMSRKLMFSAVPFPDRESQDALLRHSKTLRNVSLPILFTSPGVKSPTVWCWGLHPAVLLPESIAEQLRDEQRDAVFLHELSHVIRRDHLSSLFVRISGAVLFWNPLYWFVLRASDLAADESCDLLVLTEGKIPPGQYSETLLRLAAGERRPILQFLSLKEKIMRRIDRISKFEHVSHSPQSARPIAGSRIWTSTVFLMALLVSVTLAFCQEKKNEVPAVLQNGKQKNAESISLSNRLGIDGLKPYRVDKRIADFPEKFDLSTPESAYATQKQIIVSNADDKFEQLKKMNYHKGEMSERERKSLEKETDPDWAKTYKNEFAVLEVIPFGKDRAFVFGLRRFDMLYDGNYFQKKEDGLWYNHGNDQAMKIEQMVSRVKKTISRESAADRNSIKDLVHIDGMESARIDKLIIDFPDKFDLSTPEAAYATQKILIVSNADDKFEQLKKMNYNQGEMSDRERQALASEIDPEWAKTYKTEFIVYEVLKIKPDLAFVFSLRKFDKLYDGNFFQKKDDGNWYNLGNLQDFDPAEMAKDVEETFRTHFPDDAALQKKNAASLPGEDNPIAEETPVVVKLEPANASKNVDATALKELRVTFDIDMNTESFSWCGGGETFPKTTGKPKWIDKRTCVLPVELEPGKSYSLGINAPSFKGFQSEAGVPLEPLTYKFSTK